MSAFLIDNNDYNDVVVGVVDDDNDDDNDDNVSEKSWIFYQKNPIINEGFPEHLGLRNACDRF